MVRRAKQLWKLHSHLQILAVASTIRERERERKKPRRTFEIGKDDSFGMLWQRYSVCSLPNKKHY
jgi:hypothetical protein